MNPEVLKMQLTRLGIHLLSKTFYILNNGLTHEILYDLIKDLGPLGVYNEIKRCFRKDVK